jgi:hypothetical protein
LAFSPAGFEWIFVSNNHLIDMKNLPFLALLGLLAAAPAARLSATHFAFANLQAMRLTTDAGVDALLALAAPTFGVSAATLQAAYRAGRASVRHLSSTGTQHRYEVGYGGQTAEYIVIGDLVPS